MKFNLSHRLLTVAITLSSTSVLCPEIKAQNVDVFNNNWGWNQGQRYNNESRRGGWNQSQQGYTRTIRNHDNHTTTKQWGQRNSQSKDHQSGNCNTGNCSYSSSYSSSSRQRSRTFTTPW